MKILSWNVRGLRSPQTFRRLRRSLKTHNPQVIFFMETKVCKSQMKRVRHRCGYLNGFEADPISTKGDFNKTMYGFGKNGGLPRDERKMENFRNVLADCQLLDVGLTGIGKCISEEDNQNFTRPYTTKEIREALFVMGPTKVPAKAIANRFRGVIEKCINVAKSAFVPSRLISNNVLLAYEILHTLQQKRVGKKGFMAVKLDMSQKHKSASGLVVWSRTGELLAMKTVMNENVPSPFAAEAYAVLQAVKLGISMALPSITVMGDSRTVIKKCQLVNSDKSVIGTIISNLIWPIPHIFVT
ncbi:hypothetical protein J1N35_038166 [Gossypium stocksii]|uniref:RNase H type-1 domain-containing protein n=1 Tax=Gossypium stocksii TaxID=47602 RepID=A0A9D3ULC8_9ROSI|nr:hypothetical protein J1N35_038166 [Gossypium stocksii]